MGRIGKGGMGMRDGKGGMKIWGVEGRMDRAMEG